VDSQVCGLLQRFVGSSTSCVGPIDCEFSRLKLGSPQRLKVLVEVTRVPAQNSWFHCV
jgi:hypothetical protein